MKKLLTLFLLATLLLTACANPNPPIDETATDVPSGNETTLAPPNDDTTTDEDTETTSNEEFDTTLKFEPDIDLTQTEIWHSNWEGFSQNLIDSDIEIDSIKGKIMTYPIIELNDYKTLLISFSEEIARNERQEIEKDFNWSFGVLWKHEDYETTIIGHRLYYYADGMDINNIIRGGLHSYDPLSDIYTVRVTGETLYYCWINEKMYMSIVIKTDCRDFQSISKQFIDYALEIKKIVNTEGVQ